MLFYLVIPPIIRSLIRNSKLMILWSLSLYNSLTSQFTNLTQFHCGSQGLWNVFPVMWKSNKFDVDILSMILHCSRLIACQFRMQKHNFHLQFSRSFSIDYVPFLLFAGAGRTPRTIKYSKLYRYLENSAETQVTVEWLVTLRCIMEFAFIRPDGKHNVRSHIKVWIR